MDREHMPPGTTTSTGSAVRRCPHLHVLSANEVDVLRALGDTLLPGDDVWPSGSDVGIEEHVDEMARTDVVLRAFLYRELRELDVVAHQLAGQSTFAAASPLERENVVRAIENRHPEIVRRLVELAFEAYYQHPRVHKAMAERTGYHFDRSLHGVTRSSTDEILSLLAEQAERDRHVRTVEGE